MSRRVNISPAAAEAVSATVSPGERGPALLGARAGSEPPQPPRRGTGRVRHDEKITVYISTDELLALEHARLTLRADHGLAVDRGRIVREAVSLALSELADRRDDSELMKRLRGV